MSLNMVDIHDYCIFVLLAYLLPVLLHVPFFFPMRGQTEKRSSVNAPVSL